MVLVKFKRQWRIYNDGEVTGWDEDFANKLVDSGVAEYVKSAAEGGNTPPPGDDDHGAKLTLTKFARLNLEELVALAKENEIDIGDATLKKDVQPIVKKALFPDADGDD